MKPKKRKSYLKKRYTPHEISIIMAYVGKHRWKKTTKKERIEYSRMMNQKKKQKKVIHISKVASK